MRFLWLTAVLALAPASLACPVKPGTFVNGLLKPTPLLRPVCGDVYAAYKRSFEQRGAAWGELYEAADPKQPLAALAWIESLRGRGYTLKLNERKGTTARLGFENGARRIFVSFDSLSGVPVVGIMGN